MPTISTKIPMTTAIAVFVMVWLTCEPEGSSSDSGSICFAWLARSSLRSDLYGALAGLTARVIRATPDGGVAGARIEQWERLNAEGLARAKSTLTEIAESPAASLATISVALRVIRTLVYQAPGD